MTDTVEAPRRFIGPSESFSSVGLDVSGIAFGHPLRLRWWLAFLGALGLLGLLAAMIVLVLFEGVGVWGNNVPVTWALDIVSYDWWIGIASGGLLISAVLMMFGTEWRGALNRLTETGALIAAAAAAPATRSSTSAGPGSSTGICPIPTPSCSGRSSARRSTGTRWTSSPTS